MDSIIEMEKEYLVPAITHYYEEPKLFVKGEGAHLIDSDGKKYLDLFAGICTMLTGYSHPTMTESLKKQVDSLIHTSTLYPTVPMALYAKELSGIAPEGLDKCYFVNSGSEANEAAMFLMKMHTGSNTVISLNESFHGRTLGAMSITNQGTWRQNTAYATGVIGAPNANCYRCDFGKTPDTCSMECAHFVEKTIKCQTSGDIAGLVAEPIQGNGGLIDPPAEYFPIIVDTVHDHGGLFLSDEVQTGFGRTGKTWGIENWDVKPDIITMAKGIASGFPCGAFVTTEEIASCLKPKGLFSTYGGNPMAMIAGLANLDIMEQEDYTAQAVVKGRRFKKGLEELMESHPLIGDIRGKGLMLGFELVEDRQTKEPAPEKTQKMLNLAFEKGVMLGVGGLHNNVVRIKPPLMLSNEQIDHALEVLDEVLTIIGKK
ncbi:MAG TPA: aspartate aminotransferase family protein [Candidatus Poseidoniales archaeon]|nr:aspartate aminotransferase family protein [Candidatus Poseidoniales archaeon]